jgi:hypothetical protein
VTPESHPHLFAPAPSVEELAAFLAEHEARPERKPVERERGRVSGGVESETLHRLKK